MFFIAADGSVQEMAERRVKAPVPESTSKGAPSKNYWARVHEAEQAQEQAYWDDRTIKRDMSYRPLRKAPVKQMRQRCKTERRHNLQPNRGGSRSFEDLCAGSTYEHSEDRPLSRMTKDDGFCLKADPRRAKRR
jgi:hypothetical protein